MTKLPQRTAHMELAESVQTPQPPVRSARFWNSKIALTAWLCGSWLLMLPLRYTIAQITELPSSSRYQAAIYGVMAAISFAQLFAIATIPFLSARRPRILTAIGILFILVITLIISRNAYPDVVIELWPTSCVRIAVYALTFTVYWFVSRPADQATPKQSSRFTIQDALLLTLLCGFALALTRTDASRIVNWLKSDLQFVRGALSYLYKIAILGLMESLLSVFLIHQVRLGRSCLRTCIATGGGALLFTLALGVHFFILRGGAQGNLLAQLKDIAGMVVLWSLIFTIYFTTSMFLFRSISLLPKARAIKPT